MFPTQWKIHLRVVNTTRTYCANRSPTGPDPLTPLLLDAPDTVAGNMFFGRSKKPDEMARVRAEVARLHQAFVEQAEARAAMQEALDAKAKADAEAAGLPAPDPTAGLSARIDTIAEQLALLETRLTSVSTELVNQLSELGNDIDALQNRPDPAPLDDETIETLRDTQTRLANEQARYQIAFRSDLARLAEQVRKTR